MFKVYLVLVVVASLSGLASPHQSHKEVPHDDIIYIDYLLGKYATLPDQLDMNEVDTYLDSYYELVRSIRSQTSDVDSKLECFKSKLTDFLARLNDRNSSRLKSIDAKQFLKLNTFLVANLDSCYQHRHESLQNGSNHSHELVSNETGHDENNSEGKRAGHMTRLLNNALKIPKEGEALV
jgi:hypothetical protein